MVAIALLYATVFAGCTHVAGETQQNTVELVLPRASTIDEAVWLQIRTGGLPRGAGGVPSTQPRPAAPAYGCRKCTIVQPTVFQVSQKGSFVRRSIYSSL